MMNTSIDLVSLTRMLTDAAELGAARAAEKWGASPDEITQREAYRRFGEAEIKLLDRLGAIKKLKNGPAKNSPWRYSLSEIEAARKARRALKENAL